MSWLKIAYLQITLDQSSSVLTTISTFFGWLKYNYLPCSVRCSSDIFQKVLFNVVIDLKDIDIIHSSDKVEIDQRLISLSHYMLGKSVAVNSSVFVSCASFQILGD